MTIWQQFKNDFSISAFVAGLIAVIISLTGPVAIVFQAAKAGNLTEPQLISWVWAICMASGLCGLLLSLRYKTPVICAFSSGGAALMINAMPHYSYNELIGAYLFSATLIIFLGFSGLFSRLMQYIPKSIVAGMLAGILFEFGAGLFSALSGFPALVLPIIIAYLLTKRWSARYAVLMALITGLLLTAAFGKLDISVLTLEIATPVFTSPAFSLQSIIGVGIPLAFVALASQYAPGIGVLQASGYHHIPVSPLITQTGLASLLLAPFGLHGATLAAITAAICTGPEAHPDSNRRYIAGIVCGVFYILFGIFATLVTSLFIAIPETFVATLAGLALLGALSSGLAGAMQNESQRESGLITFLIAASGISFFGIGAAFWGLVGGVLTHLILLYGTQKHAA